ncbi:hypothetical protein A2U01_0080601, partial [Trifolium medium]|nr:hypothetical protein [Trifolium medium]
ARVRPFFRKPFKNKVGEELLTQSMRFKSGTMQLKSWRRVYWHCTKCSST